jgi:outer membrane immunogenic protein
MKKLKFAAAVLAAALSVGSAFAADLPSRKAPPYFPPPPPPPPMWTGFYVGLNAGGTWSETNHVDVASSPIFPGVLPSFLASLANGSVPVGSNGGFIGGGQIGYNYQFATNFVAGVEADIQGIASSHSSGSAATAGILNVLVPLPPVLAGPPLALAIPANTTLTATKSVDYIGTVRGRLGFLVTPTLLAYATGGLAYGGVNASTSVFQSILGVPFGYGASSYSDTRVGWTAGGGLEWMFAPNWSAKAEYLYYDLGNVSYNTVVGILPPFLLPYAASQSSTRFNGHIVRAGVNYHFNWGSVF